MARRIFGTQCSHKMLIRSSNMVIFEYNFIYAVIGILDKITGLILDADHEPSVLPINGLRTWKNQYIGFQNDLI